VVNLRHLALGRDVSDNPPESDSQEDFHEQQEDAGEQRTEARSGKSARGFRHERKRVVRRKPHEREHTSLLAEKAPRGMSTHVSVTGGRSECHTSCTCRQGTLCR